MLLVMVLLQHAVRQVALDILELEHRIAVVTDRLRETGVGAANVCLESPGLSWRVRFSLWFLRQELEDVIESGEEPEVLSKLKSEYEDRKKKLRQMCGAAADAMFIALSDPSAKEALGFTEEHEDLAASEEEARIWRRRFLDPHRTSRLYQVTPAAMTKHDDPTFVGTRDLWNELNTTSDDAKLSYYELQQRKYGRGRRGSTSFAGVWEEVYDEGGTPVGADGDGSNFDASQTASAIEVR